MALQSTGFPSLDEIVLSTLDRRAFVRKNTRHADADIQMQAERTRNLIADRRVPRETQNAAIAQLVNLCGSECKAAALLHKQKHFVQVRNFETSQVFLDLRALWPETESSLLMSLVAKSKADPERFERYMKPFLDSRLHRKLLRSEFNRAWTRALNDGVLPEEKVVQEKVEAENLMEMALSESALIEQELKSARQAQAVLEAKVLALEAALNGTAAPSVDKSGALTQTLENVLCGGALTLEGLLTYADQMLSDRVLILPSAWKSAAESDKAGFSPVTAVADLFFKLARDCVDRYRQGGHFLPGSILGNGYADSEGNGPITVEGVKRRTFSYNGKTVEMMCHLKVGTGWNKGTTFRAHFCYDADLGKVVIGHFGKHLDR
jgi:hypothetical protein